MGTLLALQYKEQQYHMSKLNLKLFFKKRKQRISILGVSPRADWFFIVGVFVVTILYGIVYALYLYININNNSFFEVEEDQTVQIEIEAKKKEIQKTVEALQNQNFDETVIN